VLENRRRVTRAVSDVADARSREGWLAKRSSRPGGEKPTYALRATVGNPRIDREQRLVDKTGVEH